MSEEDTTEETTEEVAEKEEGGLAEAIFEALDKIDNQDDDTDDDLEEEVVEQEVVEETEEVTESEEEELENQDGTKPTAKTSEFIKSLKDRVKSLEAEAEEFKNRVDPESEEIKKENEALKEKIDSILFAESDEFKNKFIEPLTALNQQLGSSIKTSMKEEDRDDIETSLRSANIALSESDESNFFKEVDTITEMFGSASSRRISGLFDKIWDVTAQRREAESDLSGTRDRVLQENLVGNAKTFSKTEDTINDSFSAFETEIAPSIELYRKPELKDRFKYDEIAPIAKKAVVDGLKSFSETGAITPPLKKILMNGIIGDVHLNEKTAFIGTINNMQKVIEEEKEKVSKLSSKLKKLGVSPNRGSVRRSGKSKQDESGSGFGISEAVSSVLGD